MKPRMQRPFTGQPHRQQGAVIVLIAVAMVAILAMAALALDGGHLLVNKTRLQNAVDAAALSGAKTLSRVSGDPIGYLAAEADARNALARNASANGNGELAKALATPGFVVDVKFSNRVYGPFFYPGDADSKYVRVLVPDYGLSEFFWGILRANGDGTSPDKAASAIATAGPSPSAAPCDLAPLVVCGIPKEGTYYGYSRGDLEVLKTAANDESLANGNYQLLDFGSGGKTVGELLAGGVTACPEIGANVPTKPGNTVGPAIDGVNTRMNEYNGGFKNTAGKYPPDLVVDYEKVNGEPALSLDGSGAIVYGAGKKNAGTPVSADSGGNIYYTDASGARVDLLDLKDWEIASANCVLGKGNCTSGGKFERRILKIVVGNCTGLKGGATKVPVLGFGCYFMVQPGIHTGGDAQIFGQFVEECEGDGVAGPEPVDDVGPQIIQLYKTYLDSGGPSPDS